MGQSATITPAIITPVTISGHNGPITAAQRAAAPPGLEGPGPVLLPPPIHPDPAFPAETSPTGAEKGGQRNGRGAWGFCEFCQRPLGKLTHSQANKRFCSGECRAAALRARISKVCEMCGALCRAPENRTCGHACAVAWRRKHMPGVYSEDRAARIRDLFAQGLTQADIAAQVGASQSAIAGFRRRHLPAAARPNPARPRPPPAPRASRVLLCQPENADRSQPGRYCSAHPEIRWHPLTYRCRAADPARDTGPARDAAA